MKSYRRHLFLRFVMGIFLFIGPMLSGAAGSTQIHPDYSQKAQAMKGKNAFKFDLPDDKYLTVVGTADDIKAGNYITTMSPLIDPKDPSVKLFYIVEFENHHQRK